MFKLGVAFRVVREYLTPNITTPLILITINLFWPFIFLVDQIKKSDRKSFDNWFRVILTIHDYFWNQIFMAFMFWTKGIIIDRYYHNKSVPVYQRVSMFLNTYDSTRLLFIWRVTRMKLNLRNKLNSYTAMTIPIQWNNFIRYLKNWIVEYCCNFY